MDELNNMVNTVIITVKNKDGVIMHQETKNTLLHPNRLCQYMVPSTAGMSIGKLVDIKIGTSSSATLSGAASVFPSGNGFSTANAAATCTYNLYSGRETCPSLPTLSINFTVGESSMNGKVLRDIGLFTTDETFPEWNYFGYEDTMKANSTLFARATFSDVTKSDTVSVDFTWNLSFA